MTHLFAADEADGQVTQAQLARLDEAVSRISAAGLFAEWLNVGNSAALLAGQARAIAELAARHGMKALLRPGLALYGLVPRSTRISTPQPEPASLAAARASSAARARVEGLGRRRALGSCRRDGGLQRNLCGHRAHAPGACLGGLRRRPRPPLGNRFSLLVRGQRAPLVGRVSMDQTVLDVTEIPGVAGRRRGRDSRRAGQRNNHRVRPRRCRGNHSLGGLHAHRRAGPARRGLSSSIKRRFA